MKNQSIYSFIIIRSFDGFKFISLNIFSSWLSMAFKKVEIWSVLL